MSPKPISEKHTNKYFQLGFNIAYYRKLKGYTQEELAEKIDLHHVFLSKVEAPSIPRGISLETLFNIAEALEIEPHKLLVFRD